MVRPSQSRRGLRELNFTAMYTERMCVRCACTCMSLRGTCVGVPARPGWERVLSLIVPVAEVETNRAIRALVQQLVSARSTWDSIGSTGRARCTRGEVVTCPS